MIYIAFFVYSIAIVLAYRLGLSDGLKMGTKAPGDIQTPVFNIMPKKADKEAERRRKIQEEREKEQQAQDEAVEAFISAGGIVNAR